MAVSGCAAAGSLVFQPTSTRVLPLGGDTTIGQTLGLPGATVTGVDLNVATFAQLPQPDDALVVSVDDARTRVPATDLVDNAYVAATFDEPVVLGPDGGRLTVRWTGDTGVALYANVPDEDPPAGALRNDPYPAGTLLLDGEPSAGDLAMRVRGAPAPRAEGPGSTALARLGQRPGFLITWLIALAVCGVVALSGSAATDRPGHHRATRRRSRQRGAPPPPPAEFRHDRPHQQEGSGKEAGPQDGRGLFGEGG